VNRRERLAAARLYFIGDAGAPVEAALRGGADLFQLRDKELDPDELLRVAVPLRELCRAHGALFVVNDHAGVAAAADADGVHVGQDDMPAEDARRLLGRQAIIGVSIKSVALANAAPLDVIDYAGIGGVYATTSKDNPDPPIGVAGLRAIVAALRARSKDFPVCGIAGIDAGNAAPVIEAGADGVAVISALSMQDDPEHAARELRGIVDRARAKR
jgi:thiamine-phosphate pyrophosphorylase